jgi:hypothetical protein
MELGLPENNYLNGLLLLSRKEEGLRDTVFFGLDTWNREIC